MKTFRVYDNLLILLGMRNISDKVARKIKTQILRSKTFFLENRAVYEIMSKNILEPEGPQMTSQFGAYELNTG